MLDKYIFKLLNWPLGTISITSLVKKQFLLKNEENIDAFAQSKV